MGKLGLEESSMLQPTPSKVSFEACINLQNLYKEYKDRYKQFFESLVQKNDEELKMLTFRLDFNEYYTDKFYQASSDFAFRSQEDFKGSGISIAAEGQQPDQPIIVVGEDVKTPQPPKEEAKGTTKETKKTEPKPEERKMLTRRVGSSATKIMRPPAKEDPTDPSRKSGGNDTKPTK
jgi:hypothetical protein